jgi:lipopolysaccharide export LptBFGC system permease protein LptF
MEALRMSKLNLAQ